jgi:HSP20 family protein
MKNEKGEPVMIFRYPNVQYPFHQLRDGVDRLFTGVFGPTAETMLPPVFRSQPAVNVWERDEALVVEMEVPGVKSDQVDVSVVGGELSIKIERPQAEQPNVKFHRCERPVGSFTRVLRLPVEVDANRVEAELHDGVLSVTLPKADVAKPRKINVAAG